MSEKEAMLRLDETGQCVTHRGVENMWTDHLFHGSPVTTKIVSLWVSSFSIKTNTRDVLIELQEDMREA